jgi:heme exporter protein B
MNSQATFWRHTFAHLSKDLRLEWRSRDALIGMLFFSLLVIVVFSLAFEPTSAVSRQIAGGILWMVLLFAATTGLNQSWNREQRNGVLDAQRLSPASPAALFLGKALANLIFVTVVEVLLAPLFVIFYNLHALGEGRLLLLVMPLGTWAIVANGTFFAALGLRTRNRELMLPLVLFPISIPALLAMVQSTTNILTGEYEPGLWIKLLVGYDIVFTTACLLLFEIVLNAE